MDLLQFHGVQEIPLGLSNLDWAKGHERFLPSADRHSVEWFMRQIPKDDDPKKEEKMKRLAGDMLPARVGALGGQLHRCVPVSWASVMQMIKAESRLRVLESERFMVLAIIFLVISADKKLVLIRRSDKVTQYKGCYHLSAAGYVDVDATHEFGLEEGIRRVAFKELKEEVNLDESQVQNFREVGIFKMTEPDSANIDFSFLVDTELSGEEILSLARGAKDTYEGKHHLIGMNEAEELLKKPIFVPSGAASIGKILDLV